MWDVLRDKCQESGKIILRVNVDETVATLGFAGHSGILKQKNKYDSYLLQDLAATRSHFSNIAFISDNPEVQVLLSQIIVAIVSCFDARKSLCVCWAVSSGDDVHVLVRLHVHPLVLTWIAGYTPTP